MRVATIRRIPLAVLFFLAALAAPVARAQTFDTYGGWIQSPCAGGSTTHWYTEKAGNQWWFCTPSGNHYFFEGVGDWEVPGDVVINTSWASGVSAKYGGSVNTAAVDVINKFTQGFHFNAVGELTGGSYLYPWSTSCTGCTKLPAIQTLNVSTYSTVNLSGFGSRPTKNFIFLVNNYALNAAGWYGGAGCTDAFDPAYATFANGFFANGSGLSAIYGSAYFIGLMGDDTDFLCGVGGTPDFDTVPVGHNKPHLGFITLLASPVETFNPGTGGLTYSNTAEDYTDTTLYTKDLMASPPTTCAIATPCSLATYLSKEYGAIAALNTAWGSNYTTFGTTGTSFTSFTCGTGNGTATVFNCTIPNTVVSPFSVSVSVGGTLQGGDCPWFQSSCGVTGSTVTPYNCSTAGNCVGSFGGPSGTTILKGTQVWLSDNPCTGSGTGLPAASYWAQIIYHGTNPASPSRQTGETCTASQYDFVTGPGGATGGVSGNPSWATGYDVYMACRVVSGAAASGCAASSSGQPAVTLQSSNVPIMQVTSANRSSNVITVTVNSTSGLTAGQGTSFDGTTCSDINDVTVVSGVPVLTVASVTDSTHYTINQTAANENCTGGTSWGMWRVPNTGLVAGSALPAVPSTIDYGTGAVNLQFSSAPANAAAITINYVQNGWMFGTGLEDEDGRHTSWVGTNSICLTAAATCVAGDNGAPNANANLGADLDAWLTNYSGEYFHTVRTAIKSADANALYLGCDTLGDWSIPARKQILQGASPYVDVLFTTWFQNQPSVSTATQMYQYASQYFGDKPMMNFWAVESYGDSAISYCSGCNNNNLPGITTQPQRGSLYYGLVNSMLTAASFNGTHQWVGIVWWGSHDFNTAAEVNNWGLCTPSDNCYDAREPATTSISCSAPTGSLTCGSEPTPAGGGVPPFGNLLGGTNTGVIAANQLWYQTASTVFPTSQRGRLP